MNWLDKFVSYVDPQAGALRARARLAERSMQDLLARRFDAASSGRRTDGWRTPSTSANSANAPALVTLRNRSRDLVRNNPYAAGAIDTIESNVIGTGIIPEPKGRSAKSTKDIKALWEEWGESTDCDADGLLNFYGLQGLIMRTIAESGECLIRRLHRPSGNKLPVPMQLQVLEPDFIDVTKNGEVNGGYILQGVEFNSSGKRVGYWLFPQHPGDIGYSGRSINIVSTRVDAADILHLYRVDRAGQVRGIPWGTSIIVKLRDYDELEDAHLVRSKVAACFSAFVYDREEPLDGVKSSETIGTELEPGAIEILPPGKEIVFPTVPSVSDDGHSSRVLHAVAKGFGVTYEALTGDFSAVNFSSGRMGWLEFQRNIEKWRWNMLVPRLCVPVWRWFREAAYLEGYSSLDSTATWTPPRREMIDPSREIPAIRNAIRSGIKTLSEAIREQGNDPEALLLEWKKDADMLDKLGLVLDSDPRKISGAGGIQSDPNKDGGQE